MKGWMCVWESTSQHSLSQCLAVPFLDLIQCEVSKMESTTLMLGMAVGSGTNQVPTLCIDHLCFAKHM
jgi:hypothetical protein